MLQVKNVDLHYGASQALRGVDLSAEVGQVTCVMGRNGVGKTSLLRAIVGQQATSGGKIIWEGEDIVRLKPFERARRGIAYVPQGREIFPLMTVEENLRTGFAPLPGGQQQQLAIARALVTRPRLLVLDEPTEGIQPSIIKDIERVIRLLASRGDMAVLLVEQYFEFARDLADAFCVMDRGEVVLAGAKEEMVEEDVRRHLIV